MDLLLLPFLMIKYPEDFLPFWYILAISVLVFA